MNKLTIEERAKLLEDLELCEEGVVFTPQAVKKLILRLLEIAPDDKPSDHVTFLRGGRL